MDKEFVNQKFLNACTTGNLNEVNFYLTSPAIKLHANINVKDNNGFTGLMKACANNHLDVVKFLLSSPQLKKHANVHARSDLALWQAIYRGNTEIVKYLLTSDELTDRASEKYNKKGFITACRFGYKDLAKFFLTSDELKIKINVHEKRDVAFKELCNTKIKNINDSKQIDEILEYLILDYKIEKTQEIKNFLQQHPELKFIDSMFHAQELTSTLTNKQTTPIKVKI